DLVEVDRLKGPASTQFAASRPEIARLLANYRGVAGVRDATFMVEAVLPSFYLPGYGLRGVPVYLLADVNAYRQRVYSEPRVGLSADFDDIVADAASGGVAVSPPVARFWRLEPRPPVLLRLDAGCPPRAPD